MGKWKDAIDQIDLKKDKPEKIVRGLVFLCSQVNMDQEDNDLLEEKIQRFGQYRRENDQTDRVLASFLQEIVDDKEMQRILGNGEPHLTKDTPEQDWMYISYSQNGQYLRGFLSLRNRLNVPRMKIDEDGNVQQVKKLKEKGRGDLMQDSMYVKSDKPVALMHFFKYTDKFFQTEDRKGRGKDSYFHGIPAGHIHYMLHSIPMTEERKNYIKEEFQKANLRAYFDKKEFDRDIMTDDGFVMVDKESINTGLERIESKLTKIKVSEGHTDSPQYTRFHDLLQECSNAGNRLETQKIEDLQRAAQDYINAKKTLGFITYRGTEMGRQRLDVAKEVYDLCRTHMQKNNKANPAADGYRKQVSIAELSGAKNQSKPKNVSRDKNVSQPKQEIQPKPMRPK